MMIVYMHEDGIMIQKRRETETGIGSFGWKNDNRNNQPVYRSVDRVNIELLQRGLFIYFGRHNIAKETHSFERLVGHGNLLLLVFWFWVDGKGKISHLFVLVVHVNIPGGETGEEVWQEGISERIQNGHTVRKICKCQVWVLVCGSRTAS